MIGQTLDHKGKKNNQKPWVQKRIQAQKVADLFDLLGDEDSVRRASFMKCCGNQLEFLENDETGEKFLKYGQFCRQRMCPLCQWRRSLRIFSQVHAVMEYYSGLKLKEKGVFLTLTVKNVDATELKPLISRMIRAWDKLCKRRNIKKFVCGWFRSLEVTYNREMDTYHPHFHVILLLDKVYFSRKEEYYMTTAEWSTIWGECLEVDYSPIVHLERIKDITDYRMIAEMAKYSVKPSDFIIDDDDATAIRVIYTLQSSLFRRRLCSFGGNLRKISRKLKIDLEDDENFQMTNIDYANLMKDEERKVYSWNPSLKKYICTSVRTIDKTAPNFVQSRDVMQALLKLSKYDYRGFYELVTDFFSLVLISRDGFVTDSFLMLEGESRSYRLTDLMHQQDDFDYVMPILREYLALFGDDVKKESEQVDEFE